MLKKSKRFLTAAVSVITALAMCVSTFAAITYGDVDKSGNINVADARLVLRFAVQLEKPANDEIAKLADVDGDGDIDVSDARLVLRVAVQLDDPFPVFENDVHEHTYGEFVTVKEATCTEKGLKQKTCTVCGDVVEEEIEALGHNLVKHDAKAPTCTEKGWDAYETCSKCDYTTYNEKVALGHTYGNYVKGTNNTHTHTCSACGNTETKNCTFTSVVTKPTCTEKGYTTHTCSVCGNNYKDNETEATGHKYSAVVTAPTCTEKGYTTHTCSVCGDSYKDTETNALGHDFSSEWKIDTEATCTTAGSKSHHCSRCDVKSDVTVIEALGHDYSKEWTVDVAKTCTTAGSKSHHCTRCDAKTDVTEIEAGHDYSVDNSIFPKTQEEAGEGNLYIAESPVCRLCGKVSKTANKNVAVFNNMVNIIKNNFNYRSSHNIKRIIKETETTDGSNINFGTWQTLVEDQIKSDFGTETTYRYTEKISKIASATSLPYLQYTVSNLQKDDISGFNIRMLDGLNASDVLKDYPDTITVGSNTKDITADKNKSWSGKVIKIEVKIKPQVFTVNGSTNKNELWKFYQNDNAYECAMSRITTEINPIRDAQAYNMDEKGNIVRSDYTISENEDSMEMSMTLKSVTASGTVTYYFDADTFEPLMAQYNLSETLIQNIKMSIASVVDGSMTTTVTNSINQVYFFNTNA